MPTPSAIPEPRINLFQPGRRFVSTPPYSDWFELIEYYAFKLTLLLSFLYTLFQVLKHKLRP